MPYRNKRFNELDCNKMIIQARPSCPSEFLQTGSYRPKATMHFDV